MSGAGECRDQYDTWMDHVEELSKQEDQKVWLECCRGYTHAPWCPAYKEPGKEAVWCPACGTLNCVNPANHQTVTSEHEPPMTDQDKIGVLVRATGEETLIGALHWIQKQREANEYQPAARGGGEWQVGYYKESQRSDGQRIAIINRPHPEGGGEDIAECLESVAQEIITAHNQHQSLVAERERLQTTLTGTRATLDRFLFAGGSRKASRDDLLELRRQIDNALADTDQRG